MRLSLQRRKTKQRTGRTDGDGNGCEAKGRQGTLTVRVEPEAK